MESSPDLEWAFLASWDKPVSKCLQTMVKIQTKKEGFDK